MGRTEQLRENSILAFSDLMMNTENPKGLMLEGGSGESHEGTSRGWSQTGIKKNSYSRKGVTKC